MFGGYWNCPSSLINCWHLFYSFVLTAHDLGWSISAGSKGCHLQAWPLWGNKLKFGELQTTCTCLHSVSYMNESLPGTNRFWCDLLHGISLILTTFETSKTPWWLAMAPLSSYPFLSLNLSLSLFLSFSFALSLSLSLSLSPYLFHTSFQPKPKLPGTRGLQSSLNVEANVLLLSEKKPFGSTTATWRCDVRCNMVQLVAESSMAWACRVPHGWQNARPPDER